MNAASRIARYSPTVDAFLPCVGEEERRLRCGVLYCRDKASAALRRARWEPSLVLRAIESMATVNAFAAMPIENLRELRGALVRLMIVAMALETRGPGSSVDED